MPDKNREGRRGTPTPSESHSLDQQNGLEITARNAAFQRLLPHRYDERAPIERLIAHLHGLGVRPLGEFLDALSIEHDITADIICKLKHYRRLECNVLVQLGVNGFAASPLRRVAPVTRRYPVVVGARVLHIDGRAGVVLELVDDPELPLALVDLEPRDRRAPHTREKIPLGYLQWIGASTGNVP